MVPGIGSPLVLRALVDSQVKWLWAAANDTHEIRVNWDGFEAALRRGKKGRKARKKKKMNCLLDTLIHHVLADLWLVVADGREIHVGCGFTGGGGN